MGGRSEAREIDRGAREKYGRREKKWEETEEREERRKRGTPKGGDDGTMTKVSPLLSAPDIKRVFAKMS